jgi:hypothetical protein
MYYKIVEVRRDGLYRTLFHGIRGSRIITPEVWSKAEIKPAVSDSKGKTYESGWHILPTWELACHYLKRFKQRHGNLIIVECEARGRIRPKPTNSEVLLADELFLIPMN